MFSFLQKKVKYRKFIIEGFGSWKRINNGERCSILYHEEGFNSHHTKSMLKWNGLKNQSQRIDKSHKCTIITTDFIQ